MLALRALAGFWMLLAAIVAVVWLALAIAHVARRWPRGWYVRVRP